MNLYPIQEGSSNIPSHSETCFTKNIAICKFNCLNLMCVCILSSFCSKKDQFKIVPILVGSLNSESEAKYGKILSKYLVRPDNFFVISSDFCHWGKFLDLRSQS